eukprot:14447047-Ditylum_brightwellii.AAC.1
MEDHQTQAQEAQLPPPETTETAKSSSIFSPQLALNSMQSSQALVSSGIDTKYNELMEKLALSMQRSDESRAY